MKEKAIGKVIKMKCPICKGSGRLFFWKKCPECKGLGVVLRFPIRMRTDDGYIMIRDRRECCDIEIKRVHEKGKTYYPNVKMRMGLSDVQFIHGSGKNKKEWTEAIHIPTFSPNCTLKILEILQIMKKRNRI